MTIRPDAFSAAINYPVAAACSNCGVEDRMLNHYVRLRGVFRRLCTNCVLRLHPQSFCPTCFHVYPPLPPPDGILNCTKCYSYSHVHCVASGATSPRSPYICPLCVSPNTPIFKFKTTKEANLETDAGFSGAARVMDRDAAMKLLTATKIASFSMNKAAAAAKVEAEKRAKESAMTRKRAKEALEFVAYLVMKEKVRKKEAVLPGVGGNVSVGFNTVEMKRENNVSVRNGITGSCVGPIVAVEEKIDTIASADKMDKSNQVLAAAVELRENEKMGMVSTVMANSDQPVMHVDGEGTMVATAEGNNGCEIHQESFADMGSGAETITPMQGTEQDDVNREGDVLVQTDQME